MHDMLRFAKRVIILVVGLTVALLGVIMIFTPGPGWGVIFAGLAILATEFAWARRWLRTLRESAKNGMEKLDIRSLFKRAS